MNIEHLIIILLVLAILYKVSHNKAKETFVRVNLDNNILYRDK
jgi:hypothetical protein